MFSDWIRLAPEVSDAGDVGGDVQVTDAYEAQFYRLLPEGRYAVTTRRYYGAADNPDWSKQPVAPQRLECQTEYIVCTDLGDPGSTEIASDIRTETVHGDGTAESARAAAETAPLPTEDEWMSVFTYPYA